MVSFNAAVKNLYINAFNFSGRATRAEFWWSILYSLVVTVLATAIPFCIGCLSNIHGIEKMENSLIVISISTVLFLIIFPPLYIFVPFVYIIMFAGKLPLLLFIPFALILVLHIIPLLSISYRRCHDNDTDVLSNIFRAIGFLMINLLSSLNMIDDTKKTLLLGIFNLILIFSALRDNIKPGKIQYNRNVGDPYATQRNDAAKVAECKKDEVEIGDNVNKKTGANSVEDVEL